MKKSSFLALVLGTISGVLFALGMCMALLPEWNALTPGIVLGSVGIVLGVITWLVWRKMEQKAPIRVSGKTARNAVVAVLGALLFGVGMCMTLVGSQMVAGIVVGLVGIVVLLCLIPLVKGLK